ncbi:MAG: hypothetical protein ABSH19_01175 [Opitutales bacterium]
MLTFAAADGGEHVVEVHLRDGEALAAAGVEEFEELGGALDVGLGAVDLEPVFAADEFDVEGLFGLGEVGFAANVELAEDAGVGESEGAWFH